MPRPSAGPRLWFDATRQNWVIRDGAVFHRTGTRDLSIAEQKLSDYLRALPADPPPPTDNRGFVYFVTAEFVTDFPVKIGFTKNIEGVRLQDLQTGVAGTYQFENALHREFKDSRLCGEWFARTPGLMAVIEHYSTETCSTLIRSPGDRCMAGRSPSAKSEPAGNPSEQLMGDAA